MVDEIAVGTKRVTDDLGQAAARGASATALAFFLTQGLLFLVYVGLAHMTSPAVFGAYAAGGVLLAAGEMVTESGISSALVQRRDNVEAAAATALVSTALGGLVLTLIALALSPVVGLAFHSREIGLVAAALSGSLVLNGVTSVPAVMLQRRLSARRFVFAEPAAVIALGAGSAAGLLVGLGVWGLVLGWYACAVVRALALWITVGWRPQLRLASWALWKEMAGFGRHILASELLKEAMRVTTSVAIGRELGPGSLSNFRFGLRLVTHVVQPVLMACAWTIQPTLARLADDPTRSRQVALSAFRLVTFAAFPISAAFIPFGVPLAVLLFGDAWRSAGTVMVALSGMGMALALEAIAIEIFKVGGRPDILPRLHALWAVLSIGLVIGLVRFGAVGVGIAWSVSTSVVALVALGMVPAVFGLSRAELARAVLPALASALIVADGLLVAQSLLTWSPQANAATLGWLLAQGVVGLAAYIALMALVARSRVSEFAGLVRIVIARTSGATA